MIRLSLKKLGALFLTVTCLTQFGAFANVSLKNGNFFIGYTDIFFSGGFEPKVDRVYNSKAMRDGVFGWGWGNSYETTLAVSPDGSIIVNEFGSGADNRFTRLDATKEDQDKAIARVADVSQKNDLLGGLTRDTLIKKMQNPIALNAQWEKLRAKNLISAIEIPLGTQLKSNRFSYQYITRVAGGYVRISDGGMTERFNEQGKLVKVSDKNNNFVDFTYGKDGHLQKMVDNFNRKIFFTFDNKSHVIRLDGENGKKAEYKYNDLGQLVYSRDVDNNTYTFAYDRNHNLLQIGYSDKTTMVMTYYGLDRNQNIKSVKDRDGTVTEYVYEGFGIPNQNIIQVNIKSKTGKVISKNKYEYYSKEKTKTKELWTERMVTTFDGVRTETVYNEDFGLPVLIKKGKEETRFEYDAKGHVIKKTTPTEATLLEYDPKASKVSSVTHKRGQKVVETSKFRYDEKGNLEAAANSKLNSKGALEEVNSVRLAYDQNGRIITMKDRNNRLIKFKYNENSKPIEIEQQGLGSITVTYSNSGEIKDVKSTAGRKIAVEVTAAFQSLLDIIRPAGVTLSAE